MLRLTTLGALDLRDRLGHPLREVLAQPKRLALLVYLVVEGRTGPVSRDRLLAMFWPESDDTKARNTLSQALHHLRQAVGPDLIESQGANALLIHGEALWCDAAVFAEALERGETELACDLYHGEFCPALFVSGAPEADEWLGARRRELRRQAAAAMRALAEQKAVAGDGAGAIRAARRVLAMQPDDEGDVRAMLALLDRSGDAAGALSAYQEFVRRLAAELELEPAPETAQLAEAIRRQREQAALSAGGTGVPPPTYASGPWATAAAPGVDARGWRWTQRHLLLASAALVLITILGSIALRPGTLPARLRGADATERRHAIAVFPFVVRGSDALSYLSDGMMDLLSAKLDGVAGFHAVDPRSVIAATLAGADTSRGAWAATAQRLGAGYFITGEVTEIAGRLQINGALHQPAAWPRAVATATVTSDTTHLFELVDALTGRMLASLLPGRDTTLTRLASLTTHSLPALKAYLSGEQAMRAGRDAAAADAFREAAALDTTFALAQYRLAVSATWVSVRGVADNATISAMAAAAARHAERLAPLVRDLLIAYDQYKVPLAEDAERSYRRITESHPDNVEAWFMLGETWFHYNPFRGRPAAEARPAFERVLALDPSNTHAAIHLARLAALEGRDRDLDSIARDYLARYRDAERTIEMRTLLAAVHGNPDEQRSIAREALGVDAIIMASLIQVALAYAQSLDLGRALAASYARTPHDLVYERASTSFLTDLELNGGRWARQPAFDLLGGRLDEEWLFEARALLAACRAVPVARAMLSALRDSVANRTYPALSRSGYPPAAGQGAAMQVYLVGLLSSRLGDTARVRTQLGVLDAMAAGDPASVAVNYSHTLRAEQFWAAGDPARARAELARFGFKMRLEVAHWATHERFLMAELLRADNRLEEALGWYESFPAGYDGPWVAPAHLRAAQLHQRLGNRERATYHYSRFVRLWSGADPQFQPMVAQARAALITLGGSDSVSQPRATR